MHQKIIDLLKPNIILATRLNIHHVFVKIYSRKKNLYILTRLNKTIYIKLLALIINNLNVNLQKTT